MTIQLGTTYRNALLDLFETTVGVSCVLRIRTGAQPANCAASRSGTVLTTIQCPSDWAADASGGSKSFLGTWSDSSADAAGTAAHFEIMDSTLTTCHMQGTVTSTGGGGDMTIDNTNIAAGQVITVTGFTLTAPGA